ncbi:Acetyltransferase (GNAT) domain-containing protein [Streptomyces sp. 2314.4]|nr:Acetyltransferase (GNAT) domain-containing protein [Streptomyces sp. 2314.4]
MLSSWMTNSVPVTKVTNTVPVTTTTNTMPLTTMTNTVPVTTVANTVSVTTWYLEQTSPDDLTPARVPDETSGIRIMRVGTPSPEFNRFLYTSVGADVSWTDRLPWTYAQWREFLDRPGVETWVAYAHGTPAGFIELDGATAEGTTEITYLGLLPAFRGHGIGGHLLSYGTARAWELAGRWEKPEVKRVWVHTLSKDGPYARGNYERRGFRVYRVNEHREPAVTHPGPWPGAGPRH